LAPLRSTGPAAFRRANEELGGGREHALLWIEENQLGRRNLSDDQRAAIGLRLSRRLSKLAVNERASSAGEARAATASRDATGKMTASLPVPSTDKLASRSIVTRPASPAAPLVPHGTATSLSDIEMPPPKRDTRAEVAKQVGVSQNKIRAAAEIEKKDPEAITRIARGETTIIQERAKLNAAARAAVAERTPTLPTGRYSCIVIDPPWQMQSAHCGSAKTYPVRSI
jgi:hypothetical protein